MSSIGKTLSGGVSEKGVPVVTRVQPNATSVATVVGTRLSRVSVTIWNYWDEDNDPDKEDTDTVFLSNSSSMSWTDGIPLKPGEVFEDNDTKHIWYGRTKTRTADLRVLEVHRS